MFFHISTASATIEVEAEDYPDLEAALVDPDLWVRIGRTWFLRMVDVGETERLVLINPDHIQVVEPV